MLPSSASYYCCMASNEIPSPVLITGDMNDDQSKALSLVLNGFEAASRQTDFTPL